MPRTTTNKLGVDRTETLPDYRWLQSQWGTLTPAQRLVAIASLPISNAGTTAPQGSPAWDSWYWLARQGNSLRATREQGSNALGSWESQDSPWSSFLKGAVGTLGPAFLGGYALNAAFPMAASGGAGSVGAGVGAGASATGAPALTAPSMVGLEGAAPAIAGAGVPLPAAMSPAVASAPGSFGVGAGGAGLAALASGGAGTTGGGGTLENILKGLNPKPSWLDYLLTGVTGVNAYQSSQQTKELLDLAKKNAEFQQMMAQQSWQAGDPYRQSLENQYTGSQPAYDTMNSAMMPWLTGQGQLPGNMTSPKDVQNAYMSQFERGATDNYNTREAMIRNEMSRRGLGGSGVDLSKRVGAMNYYDQSMGKAKGDATLAGANYFWQGLNNLAGMGAGRRQEAGQYASMYQQPAFSGSSNAGNMYSNLANTWGQNATQNWGAFGNMASGLNKPKYPDWMKQYYG